MCGRIGRPELSWAELYGVLRDFLDGMEIIRDPDAPDLRMSWNVKPTQQIDIAMLTDGGVTATTARWWFVPHWFRGDLKDWKQTTFNARIETAHEKPTFRTAWKTGRCIIPANGYFEWTGDKGAKQPWFLRPQSNDPCVFFAGLASRTGTGLQSCTILTRAALTQTAHIHSRSPVMLSRAEMRAWLTGEMGTKEAQDSLGTNWDNRMSFHKVRRFGRDDDDESLIEPLETLL